MKIKILIKDNFDKIYNILPLIKNNDFLKENSKNIQYFNENNWEEIFDNVVKDLVQKKQFDRVCIFDEDGILPFMFFTKIKGIISACPFNVEGANLSRAHNDANCIIMACKYVKVKDINNILNQFFIVKHEGGRHTTRVRLMQEPFKSTNKSISFNKNEKDTVVVCSDHAGFELKELIKQYLIKQRNLKVIDVGCHSKNSTHYPLFAIAMIQNAPKAYFGIAICSTGVGIANTINKFKGIKTFPCWEAEQAKLSRTKYNANVLTLGGKFVDFELAKKAIDLFIDNKNDNNSFETIDNYGYQFDKQAFDKIEFDRNIEIPKELK